MWWYVYNALPTSYEEPGNYTLRLHLPEYLSTYAINFYETSQCVFFNH
jgi:hypothetical protein